MFRVLLLESRAPVIEAVKAVFAASAAVRIAAVTHDGEQATRLAKVLQPDVILMNVAVCSIDRYSVLTNVMSHSPTRVIVYASGERSYDLALERAVENGALEMSAVAPNDRQGALKLCAATERLCLVDKPPKRVTAATAPLGAPRAAISSRVEPLQPTRNLMLPPTVVVVGASTGGPAVLERILRSLRAPFALPVVVAQHMTTGFNRDMVHWLGTLGTVTVKLADDREIMQPGVVYFAPDGHHVTVAIDNVLRLLPARDDEAEVPSVDKLFMSAARAYGASAIGLLLTGMGEDGAAGLHEMRLSGARTIVQNQQSSLVFGMPQAAIKLGAAQLVHNIDEMAAYLNDCSAMAKRGRK